MRGGRYTIVTFRSTFDAMEAERLCQEAGVPGRIIPLPTQLSADCGLAWRMDTGTATREALEAACAGHVDPEGWFELEL